MTDLAQQLPEWWNVQYVRVPLKYQGYVRLIHSVNVWKKNKTKAKPWSERRRRALIEKYAADIGRPLVTRSLRHIAPHYRGGYIVRFVIDGRDVSLGCFKDGRDACSAWDAWMRAWIDKRKKS